MGTISSNIWSPIYLFIYFSVRSLQILCWLFGRAAEPTLCSQWCLWCLVFLLRVSPLIFFKLSLCLIWNAANCIKTLFFFSNKETSWLGSALSPASFVLSPDVLLSWHIWVKPPLREAWQCGPKIIWQSSWAPLGAARCCRCAAAAAIRTRSPQLPRNLAVEIWPNSAIPNTYLSSVAPAATVIALRRDCEGTVGEERAAATQRQSPSESFVCVCVSEDFDWDVSSGTC